MKRENGITLIALIVTVIVLLILTGVSITTLTGENGILTQSTRAKDLVELSTLKEELQLYKLNHIDETINIDNDEINNILTTLKNTKYNGYTTIKNNKIRIDMKGVKLDKSEKDYIYENLDTFYLVEYSNDTEYEIEIKSEKLNTCIINNITQSNVNNNILKLPDYIVKEGKQYKVVGNKYLTIDKDDAIEVKKIFIPETFETLSNLGKINNLKEIYIEDGLSTVGYRCFGGYDILTYIRLPNTLKTISGAAFQGCRALKNIAIPDSVTNIREQAFIGSGLTEVIMPNSVTNIGTQIFQDCHYLEFVKFSDNTTTLPKGTFVSSLCKKIEFSKNLVDIQDNSLGCGLKKIEIPEGVKKLGNYLFSSSIEKIRIPDTVDEIGDFLCTPDPEDGVGKIVYTDNPIVIDYISKTGATIKNYSDWE